MVLVKIIRLFFLAALIAGLVYLLLNLFDKYFALTGSVKMVYNVAKKSPAISEIFPNGRISDTVYTDALGQYKKLTIDPVYFDIIPPFKASYAKVCLTYSNESAPTLYLGPQIDNGFNYYSQALENKFLDNLFLFDNKWKYIKEDGLYLWQKKESAIKFTSIAEFLNQLPPSDKIGVFNYELKTNYKMNDYKKKENGIFIDTTIRGPHTILTYVKNEPLDLSFTIQDMNRHEGPDEFEVVVLRNAQGIFSEKLADDGRVTAFEGSSRKRELSISLSNLTEGVYTVDIHTNEDIFIRRIKTNQSYLVFKHALYLADNIEYKDGMLDLNYLSNNLYTNGKNLSFRTTHKSGLQKIMVDGEEVNIDETHKLFYKNIVDSPKNIHKIEIPLNDVVVNANGLIALAPEQYFNPVLTSVDENLESSPPNINYIVAKYNRPTSKQGGLKEGCFSFFMDDYYVQNNKLRFMISSPGLELKGREINIYNISLTAVKEPWPELIKSYPVFDKIYSKISSLANLR